MSDGRVNDAPEPDDSFDDLVADPLSPAETAVDGPDAAASTTLSSGGRFAVWRSVAARNRVLWISAAVAVVALVGGLLVGRFVMAPASAAADDAPAPGLVTVPVEFGPLSNDVTIRGEVGFAEDRKSVV